jgi:predicted helicase
VLYDFNKDVLVDRVEQFVEEYNSEVARYHRSKRNIPIDDFVKYDCIDWSESLKANLARARYGKYSDAQLRSATFRPFVRKWLYDDPLFVERRYQMPRIFPNIACESENKLICCTCEAQIDFSALIFNGLPCLHVGGRQGQCFPFYVYDEDGTNRRENITDWALQHFREHYHDKKITKWDIFYYVYGILHHPGYRTKFADNLKRELPRIPLAPDFKAFAKAGQKLADLHLGYEQLEPWPLKWIETDGVPLSYHVEKMRLSKDKTQLKVNDSLTLAKIPPEVFEYRLGNRSALDWVVDQYQISTDKRSGITSDPNNPDDEQYIVRLVGQVVRVSVETVKIVNSLPTEFAPAKITSR